MVSKKPDMWNDVYTGYEKRRSIDMETKPSQNMFNHFYRAPEEPKQKPQWVCHDTHVYQEGDSTIFSYYHEYQGVKFHQKHTVKKCFNLDGALDIIQKIQLGWADDLMNGISLESLLMEQAL